MTENIELSKNRNRYLLAIIQSIQIEMDDFMRRVANKECYEMMIHEWAIRLFERGVSTDRAIHIIHRARRFVLIYKTKNHYPPTPPVTLEKILTMLNEHPKYNQLNDQAKLTVQKKIAEMFNNNARIEAIEEVLEDINPHIRVNSEQNEVTFVKITIQKILNAIRKWNLTEYWRNRRKEQP